jgi:hypothetical protein
MNSTVVSLPSNLKKDSYKVDGREFPFDDRDVRRVFRTFVKTARLTPFRFRDLRHTLLPDEGANHHTLYGAGC